MTTICKNCDNNFEGNFCNNCGQDAHTHPINWHYLSHDIQHGIFHVDKGLFYTTKELYTKPGITIRDFLNGKRIKHFKPVAMVFLLASIYGLLYHYLHIDLITFSESQKTGKQGETLKLVNDWIGTHYALSTLITIPCYALGTRLAFRKSSYNFVEHIVLNTFIAGQKLIFQFALLPLLYYTTDSTHMYVKDVAILSDLIITAWVYFHFFKGYTAFGKILRIIASYTIMMVIFTLGVTIAIFALMVKKHGF